MANNKLIAYKKAFEAIRAEIENDAQHYYQMKLLLESMDRKLAVEIEKVGEGE